MGCQIMLENCGDLISVGCHWIVWLTTILISNVSIVGLVSVLRHKYCLHVLDFNHANIKSAYNIAFAGLGYSFNWMCMHKNTCVHILFIWRCLSFLGFTGLFTLMLNNFYKISKEQIYFDSIREGNSVLLIYNIIAFTTHACWTWMFWVPSSCFIGVR